MWSNPKPDVALYCVSTNDQMMQSNFIPPIVQSTRINWPWPYRYLHCYEYLVDFHYSNLLQFAYTLCPPNHQKTALEQLSLDNATTNCPNQGSSNYSVVIPSSDSLPSMMDPFLVCWRIPNGSIKPFLWIHLDTVDIIMFCFLFACRDPTVTTVSAREFLGHNYQELARNRLIFAGL